MKKYNVGVIGYGWAGNAHIAAINATPQAQVTAVCSSRLLDAQTLSMRHGGPPIVCYSELDAMLADVSINAVSICSYPGDHARHAVTAARAGKHIILEKPIALNWEGCQEVQKAVEASGVKACVCFECRYSSQFQTIRTILDRGLLGRIHYGEVDFYYGIGQGQPQYRWMTRRDAGGSSLLAAGCHALDALLFCMGQDVETVSSYSTRSINREFLKYEFPTTSITMLKYKDGRVGKVASVIDAIQPPYFHVHLVGSEGSLLDDRFHSNLLGALDVTRWSDLAVKRLDAPGGIQAAYQKQFEAFFAALDRNEEMPFTSLAHALRTHEIMFAADHSAERHSVRKGAH